jgi:Secretion system C-terminal sorting domain
VKFIFTTPSNGAYDWIGIDLRTSNPSGLCNDGYLGVDDISLVPLCDNFCVDPDRVPATYGYYTNGIYHAGFYATQPGVGYNLNGVFHPFALYIENATHIKFEIFSNAQQVMYSVEYFDYGGIENPNYNDFLLLWDGKSDFGGCLPQDEYVYKILIENCVSYVSYTDKLAFLGPHITGCHVIPPLYNTSVPNCCDENAFYNFTSFSGVDRTDVNNLISAGVTGNVTILSGANIIWHAAQNIELGLFFQANQGSDFEASIVPCGTLRPNKIEIDDRLFNYNSKEYRDTYIELSLFPNPTAGIVNVNTNLPIVEVEIFNLHGQLVQSLPYSKELHVESLPNGIYVLNFLVKDIPSMRLKLIKK